MSGSLLSRRRAMRAILIDELKRRRELQAEQMLRTGIPIDGDTYEAGRQ